MEKTGIIIDIKLYYATVMTMDFERYKILRKRDMKLNQNIIFKDKDISNFKKATSAIFIGLFLLVSILVSSFIYFSNASYKSNINTMYLYFDGKEVMNMNEGSMVIFKCRKIWWL